MICSHARLVISALESADRDEDEHCLLFTWVRAATVATAAVRPRWCRMGAQMATGLKTAWVVGCVSNVRALFHRAADIVYVECVFARVL